MSLQKRINSALIIFSIALLFTPHVNTLWLLFKIDVFGVNFWLFLSYLLVIFSFLLSYDYRRHMYLEIEVVIIIVIISTLLLVHLARLLFYNEGYSPFQLIKLIYPFILLMVSKKIINFSTSNHNYIFIVIVAACIIEAFFGIVHTLFYKNIQIPFNVTRGELILIYDSGGTRESGTLGTPSVYANFIICGLFALIYLLRREGGAGLIKKIAVIFMLFFMFYAIILSESRYPIIIGAIAMLFAFKVKNIMMYVATIGILTFINIIYVWIFEKFLKLNVRLFEDFGGRAEKIQLYIEQLFNSPFHVFIGVPSESLSQIISASGYGLSDFSYGEIAINNGFLFSLLYFSLFFLVIIKNGSGSFLSKYMFLYILINFSITNSIYWMQWITILIPTYIVISYRYNTERSNYNKNT
jgi:hypothetical protein